jgi:hypothetical protein
MKGRFQGRERPARMGPAGFLESKSQVLVMTQAGPGSRSAATPDNNNGVIYQGVGASARDADSPWEGFKLPLEVGLGVRPSLTESNDLSMIFRSRGNLGRAGRGPESPGCQPESRCRRAGHCAAARGQPEPG